MKMCHSEVIKYIKELESRKDVLLEREQRDRSFVYIDENSKIVPEYSYEETRRQVDELDAKIRYLRHILSVANCNVMVEGFDISIGEALVLLAQSQNKCRILSSMASRQQKTQQTSYSGKMEVTECNYDVEQVRKDYEDLRLEINKLQVAIDKANLTNVVDVDL